MAYLLASKMDGAWIMKYILLVLISIISAASFAKTGYENIITFNSSNWISQKTPTGFGLSCKICDNQLMISMDIVPVNKSNKYTKSNADFISYLMVDKDNFAKKMAADAAMGGKIKLIKAIQIFLYKLALPKLDQLILLNHDDKTDLLINNDIEVKETYILGGIGLDLNQYKYSPATKDLPIQFLFIGRLLKEKGIHDFIAAAQIVKEKFPQTTFTVLGGIDEANLGALTQGELTQYIDQNVIDYPGHVENIAEWIKQSHVFVLPSYREGVPRSTQEAMAIGRPVITTDVPGCRDTVIDGVNGFLVPKWNPQALAEKMIYFIEHPEQVRMMGDQSHKIAIEKFDAEKVNQRLLEILGI